MFAWPHIKAFRKSQFMKRKRSFGYPNKINPGSQPPFKNGSFWMMVVCKPTRMCWTSKVRLQQPTGSTVLFFPDWSSLSKSPRWWFQILFLFSPLPREMIQFDYKGSNHLPRMVMEPKFLAEEVIVHPNHPLTRWLDPWHIFFGMGWNHQL